MKTTTSTGMPLLAALVWIGLVGVLLPPAEAQSDWEGKWTLSIGRRISFDKILNCRTVGPVERELQVTLECPDIAIDEFGNTGHWSAIKDYSIEIVVQGRKFFYYPGRWKAANSTTHSNSSSFIDRKQWKIWPGWSHDLLGNNWACFSGARSLGDGEPTSDPDRESGSETPSQSLKFRRRTSSSVSSGSELLNTDRDLISSINQGQKSWTAQRYPQFENMTVDEMTNLAGGIYSLLDGPMKPGVATEEQRNATALLPKNFDWRNINGKNFVTPVRNQGYCGSCYAFAVTAVMESRVRILTNNKVAPTFSPQDIVDCCVYSYGCNGGNMFAIGKYGEDYGFAEESCSPYTATEGRCTSIPQCKRSYAVDYEILGSRSDGCNDLAMQLAIYLNGPIGAGYTVYRDFKYYKSGIYYHYGPAEVSGGHAVTVVGWGEDERTETKYWIVKNSWGTWWGENGYFRIIRGLNECGFEERAFQASPIL